MGIAKVVHGQRCSLVAHMLVSPGASSMLMCMARSRSRPSVCASAGSCARRVHGSLGVAGCMQAYSHPVSIAAQGHAGSPMKTYLLIHRCCHGRVLRHGGRGPHQEKEHGGHLHFKVLVDVWCTQYNCMPSPLHANTVPAHCQSDPRDDSVVRGSAGYAGCKR